MYHFVQYTFQRDTQCSRTDCLLILRCQLYMFRTVTVHAQELLRRYCMCRLWYVLMRPAGTTFEEEAVLPQTLYQRDVSAHTIVCTYSVYKEAPEHGPLRSETCRADTWVLINNQCNYIVYLSLECIYIVDQTSVNALLKPTCLETSMQVQESVVKELLGRPCGRWRD